MGIKCYYRHRSFIYILSVLFILAQFSCTKPQIQYQTVFNGNNVTNIVAVDTFAVKLSTVFLDSFSTSGTGVQLLGRYIDPFFGIINSRSYSEMGLPNPLPVLDNYSVYDSIQLITRINKSFYGDTTKVQRFLVSQLTQIMNFPGIQTAFFNNNSIPYDPTVLGSAEVQVNPKAGVTSQRIGDSIKIRLPDSMGEELWDLLYRQPDTISNASIWRGYFKGLTVYPDTSLAGAIYGFKDTMVMRIYYHEPGVVQLQKTIDFRTTNPVTQFNQITYNRSGTPTAPLSEALVELPSGSSGNEAFLQPITSLYTKLLFPTISDLQGYPDYLALEKAILIIKPVQGTYSPVYPLPPNLSLALTNPQNTIGVPINNGNGNLAVDYLYGTNTSYSYDLTAYIQQALKQGEVNNVKNGLILYTPSNVFNTQFNRAVFGDAFNAQKSNQISLTLYYASYN